MSTETYYLLSAESAATIRMLLLDAIQARVELDRAEKNIRDAAAHGWPASHLMADCIKPRPVELDCYQAADMAQLMDALEVARRPEHGN